MKDQDNPWMKPVQEGYNRTKKKELGKQSKHEIDRVALKEGKMKATARQASDVSIKLDVDKLLASVDLNKLTKRK